MKVEQELADIKVVSENWQEEDFDISRMERAIEKMFLLWELKTDIKWKDLVLPIAEKVLAGFDLTRPIKKTGIMKAIYREICEWAKDGIYEAKLCKYMILHLDKKWLFNEQ
jgi:hypothetical protein